jgi:alpha-1,6-mannosyltransferase
MVSHESVAGLLGLAGRVLARPAAALADLLNSRTAMHYNAVICTTDWAAAEFARLGVDNLRRVPLGVDLDLFTPAARSLAVRRRYARDDEVLMVHCGRLSPEKKPERSILAVLQLRAAGVPAVLVVAGDGPLRRRLSRRAAGLPVRFAGFVADRSALAGLLASADVVLAPGPVETFGLAALEALACGTPVVVSAESALPEVIGAAGAVVCGEGFAGGVRDVLRRPAQLRRAAARGRAEEFGWPNAVAGFLAAQGLSGSVAANPALDPPLALDASLALDAPLPAAR